MRRHNYRKGSSTSQTSSTLKYEVSEAGAVAVLWSARVAGDTGFDLAVTEESVIPLSSYKWDASRPRQINIQPLPPAYTGGHGQMQLKADCGQIVAYEDHLRHPVEPTAPIKVAVEALNPDFDFRNVDVVIDENGLKKLFGFLRGNCSATSMVVPGGSRDPSFKLQVDAMGVDGPIIFTRVEQFDCIPTPPNVFGQAFEAALTRPMPIDSKAMFYSIAYLQLGQQRLVVRSQVDAWEYAGGGYPRSEGQHVEVGKGKGFFGHSSLDYVLQTTAYDGTIVELKTKRAKYQSDIDWEAYYLQMLCTGARKLVLGLQEQGWFWTPREFTFEMVRDKVDSRAMTRSLARLEEVLQEIAGAVRSSGGSLDLFYAGEGNKPLIMQVRT